MKRNNLIIYFSELLFLIYIIIFKIFILNNNSTYIDLSNFLFLGIMCFILYKLLGFPKKRANLNYNALQLIIIILIIYYIFIYFFGLFFGFLKNTYSLTFLSILKNIFSATLFYILKEIYRYLVVSKKNLKNKLPILFATLLLAILDIIMEINGYDIKTSIGVFEMIEGLIIPKLAISFFLTYVSYKFNYIHAIVFLIIFLLPKYFLPLIPDLGIYLSSITTIILLFVLYYRLSLKIEKYDKKKMNKRSNSKINLSLIILIPLLVFVGLISGLFKYHLFAIGSNSMLPYFAKGDVVLIEKLENSYDDLKEGDVLAYYYNEQILVHRIVSISKYDNNIIIKTKGDNNKDIDVWTITNDMIYGKVIYIIPYIGIPSVELSELLNQ